MHENLAPARRESPMAPPFHIRELDHVVLRVADLERSLDFYGRGPGQ
jgi:hypothetical protein